MLSMKSRYIVFKEPFKVSIEEEELRDIGPHEVIVKTRCTLISTGTELTAYSGQFPEASRWADYVEYPFRPGYCNVGEVVEVGSHVKEFEVGDRVASLGGHAEYVIVPERELIKIPDEVSDEEAVFHTIAAGVMNSVRLASVSLGDFVVVAGLGLLGQMAVMFSRLCGAFPVVAVDLADFRLKLAEKSGAVFTINAGREVVYEKVRELSEGRMADVVFEVTGNPSVIPEAIKLVRKLGKLIILSSPRGPSTLDFHDEVNAPSRIIIGTHFTSQPEVETLYFPWTRRRNTELFFNLLKFKVIDISHLVTHRFKWYEVEKVYSELWRDRTRFLGVILYFR